MIREEIGTDDGIFISERKGRSVGGQARSIWTENGGACQQMAVLALRWERSLRPRGLYVSFHQKFPRKLAGLEPTSSGLLPEDLGATLEKEHRASWMARHSQMSHSVRLHP